MKDMFKRQFKVYAKCDENMNVMALISDSIPFELADNHYLIHVGNSEKASNPASYWKLYHEFYNVPTFKLIKDRYVLEGANKIYDLIEKTQEELEADISQQTNEKKYPLENIELMEIISALEKRLSAIEKNL